MTAPAARTLLAALAGGGATARFVGGCVRDTLAGRPVHDIDIATEATPDRVAALLRTHGIRTIPTGLAHGTLTALVEGELFEVTTLRRDVETDGRRAVVAFTKDWLADAARRDFTFNALYLDADGTLYDPTGGRADLEAGRVRFVGEARERLAEDVLRLLRFFRFHASYGRGAPDPGAMAACRDFSPRLSGLSGERVWAELGRILCTPDPGGTLRLMGGAGALAPIVPGATAFARLDGVVGIEAALGLGASAIRRLAAVLEAKDAETGRLARRLRMSRAEAARLKKAVAASGALIGDPDPAASGCRLYRWGEEAFADALAIAWAGRRAGGGDEAAFESAARALAAWRRPVFPLGGRDAIALGAPPGPAVGSVLREVEAWWIAEGFAPGRDACLARLAAAAAS
ncbi:MAG: CCA tRNA nucleotidyltransferase [Defluviicoccus sp.]|nr:CCA tRNA nucleotidyltransferase [Defluviicoccus sp.]MDE0383828.1 CCA tRNA nucleotidyltransferase [Defluviicoccus sp.]